jgi:hypothetical protein
MDDWSALYLVATNEEECGHLMHGAKGGKTIGRLLLHYNGKKIKP